MTSNYSKSAIALIAIGRNEGQRLLDCIKSCIHCVDKVIYVDSGSNDGSVDNASLLGAEVISLDMTLPFTAARARNAGLAWVQNHMPDIEYIQFVDGDCYVDEQWIETGYSFLCQNHDYAVVCGRRKEKYPEHSLYNKLCDIEWNSPIGDAKNCGGDALYRITALQEVYGFNPNLIAGEEPDLCFRMRKQGWKVFRYDAPMTYHDADMTRFSQWWKRATRSGHAYAEGMYLHGRSPERYYVKDSISIWIWGFIIPLLITGLVFSVSWYCFLLVLLYPLQVYKIMRYQHKRGYTWQDSLLYSSFCVLGKFAQLTGQLKFFWGVVTGKRTKLIEYK